MSVPTHTSELAHEALFYTDNEQFLETAIPFVREGLAAREPVLAVTDEAKIDLLRSALDGEGASMKFAENTEWYASPGKATASYEEWTREQLNGPVSRIRILGEPPWGDRSDAAVREWTRYESFLNVGFQDDRVSIVCPYDTTAVPSSIVVGAHRTHPVIRHEAGTAPSELFTEPNALSRELDESPLPESPSDDAHELEFANAIELREVRRFLEEVASSSALSTQRVADLALAGNEIATNALKHGGGQGKVRMSRDNGRILTDVFDRGPGIQDAFPGCRPPSHREIGGWGLWVTRQLCDLVEVRSGSAGTTVRLHMAVGP